MEPPPQRDGMDGEEGQRNFSVINVCPNVPPCFQGVCYVLPQGAGWDRGSQQSLKQPTLAWPLHGVPEAKS